LTLSLVRARVATGECVKFIYYHCQRHHLAKVSFRPGQGGNMPQNDKTKRKAATRRAIAICHCRTNNIKFKANGGGRLKVGGAKDLVIEPRQAGSASEKKRNKEEDRNRNESETGHNACGKWKVAECLYSQERPLPMEEGWK